MITTGEDAEQFEQQQDISMLKLQHKPTASPVTKAVLNSFLPSEILETIFQLVLNNPPFSIVTGPEIDTKLYGRRDLVSCSLVCSHWYNSALAVLWSSPSFHSITSFDKFLRVCNSISIRNTSLQPVSSSQSKKRRRNTDATPSCDSPQSNLTDASLTTPTKSKKWIGTMGPRHLRDFDVSSAPFLPNYIKHEHLSILCETRPPLTRLSLAGCRAIDDPAVSQIVCVVSSTLNSLNLSECIYVTDLGVSMVAQFCGPSKLLREFRLRNCGQVSDIGLAAISANLASSLKVLDVSNCARVTDRGVFNFLRKALKAAAKEDSLAFGEDGDALQKMMSEARKAGHAVGCGRLTEFRFSGSQTGSRKLTRMDFGRVLDILSQGYPQLHTIEFSIPNPPKGAQDKLYRNFPSHNLKNLTSVHIYNARWIPEDEFRSLADTIGSTVQHLTISGAEVGEAELKYLISLCTQLQSLNLSRLTYVDITGNQTVLILAADCEDAERDHGLGFPWALNPKDERRVMNSLPEFCGVVGESEEKVYVLGPEGFVETYELTEDEDEDERRRWRLKSPRMANVLKTETLMAIARWSGPQFTDG
ncbi:hypothetical protein HDV05_001184 [Chytridiales sp. JEL 0842]|nr:hypothetical protein HDV05_001184 [Chytridiales sp. JEL 0842]